MKPRDLIHDPYKSRNPTLQRPVHNVALLIEQRAQRRARQREQQCIQSMVADQQRCDYERRAAQ